MNSERPLPPWTRALQMGLVGYVIACTFAMVPSIVGPTVAHYVGLFSDGPSNLASAALAYAAARRMRPGVLKIAWYAVTLALTLYFVGTVLSAASWLRGVDPFPGP